MFVLCQVTFLRDVRDPVDAYIGNGRAPHFSETELLYADNIVLLAKSSRVRTLWLKAVLPEFAKYYMKLNRKRCVWVSLITHGKDRPTNSRTAPQ